MKTKFCLQTHRETHPVIMKLCPITIIMKLCLIMKPIPSSWNTTPSWNPYHHHETLSHCETHTIIMKYYPIVKPIPPLWNLIPSWNSSHHHEILFLHETHNHHETLSHCAPIPSWNHPIIMKSCPIVKPIPSSWNLYSLWNSSQLQTHQNISLKTTSIIHF